MRLSLPGSNGDLVHSRRNYRHVICALCSWVVLVSCGPPTWTGGIHAMLAWSPSGVRVVEVPAGGPAERAGLRPGDRILAVDGKSLSGRDDIAVQKLLSGEVGSHASLEVLRDGETLTLTVEREPYATRGAQR